MTRLLRWLTFLAGSRVTKDDAVVIARAECESRGVAFREPVKVYRHYGDWQVWTYADHRPPGVRLVVDAGSGEVKRFVRPLPR